MSSPRWNRSKSFWSTAICSKRRPERQEVTTKRRLRGNAPVATLPTTLAGTRMGRELSSLPFRKRRPAKIHGTGIMPK
jgi:hypothetical protein